MGNQASQPKITAQDRAILQLKRQRDSVKQYQKKLAVVMDKQTQLARHAVQQGHLDKAKVYLRSKKQQQSIVTSTYDQLGNLETLIGTIEFKLIEKDVVAGLARGTEVLRRLNADMSVEKIDRVMDDLEDERLKVDEVSALLGGGLSTSEESEVDDELAALERDVVAAAVPQMPAVPAAEPAPPRLPDVPETAPAQGSSETHGPLAA